MGIPKRSKSQTTADEGVLPELDSALLWYCGETISVPLGKRRPKFSNDHEPSPRCQSRAKLPHHGPHATESRWRPQTPDKAGTDRSPHSHVVSDLTQSTFGLPETSVESSEGRGPIMNYVCSVSGSVECEKTKNSESEGCSLLKSPTMQYPSVRNAGNWIDGVSEGALPESSLRLSPIANKCARDTQIDEFSSEERSALDERKLLEDSREQWTGTKEATFTPGTKMKEAILVQDAEPGLWGTKTANSRRNRPASATACLEPLQPPASAQVCLKPLQRQRKSMADWQFGCSTDIKTSPDTIKQRLDAGLQRCMKLRLTELLEHGDLLYLGNKDDKAITALNKKNSGFELRRSESDSSLLSSKQKMGWPPSPQGQIHRGLKPCNCWNAALSPAAYRSCKGIIQYINL